MTIANTRFSPRAALIFRVTGFILVTAAIWGTYFWWRPPTGLLGLKCITHLPPGSNQVALTFDDGPHPLTTPLLLASLKRASVKATFFVVGDGMKYYPQLAQRIRQDGHGLANHSENHRNLTRISPEEFSAEVDAGFASIEKAGVNTTLFRPPGGGLNHAAIEYLYRNGKTLAWWSNNVGDWAPLDAWKIAYHMNATLRPGDIVLMHDAGTSTPQAIPVIVREGRKRGLQFVPMPKSLTK
jgi:peptidoglycan/xylan/chitin deacetylase (PgdA/CDA1 family)